MKILHVNINEMAGGASRAAHRLYTGLRTIGQDARMLVLRRTTRDPNVITLPMTRLQQTIRRRTLRYERPSRRRYPAYKGTPWSVGWFSTPVPKFVARTQPDIVHLHWIGDGYVSVEAVAQMGRPIIWTLHDMWALTGGCHYAGDCTRYQQMCGACPQLGSTQLRDLSRSTWTQKRRYWLELNLTLVAPSRWMAEAVQSSWLMGGFRLETIPNGIDTQTYRPFNRAFAREVLNLPPDKKLVLFGAYRVDDERKGLDHLTKALRLLNGARSIELVIFGESQVIPHLGLKVHNIGTLDDDRILALLYSAVDVFVAPSVQDNLPNTVMEALACGTPTVAFNVGGLPDMIDHRQNGYLAQPFDPDDLATGIRWVLEDADRHARLSAQARSDAVARFDVEKIAARYLALYTDVTRPRKD